MVSDVRFSRMASILLLLLLIVIAAGCAKQTCYIPYQAEPSPVPSARQERIRPGAPETVEKSLTFHGGPRTITHEVGPMETVWRISRMYDVTPESIYAANGLRPGEELKIGRMLTIPNARMQRQIVNLYANGQWKYIIVHHTATDTGNAKTINRSHGERGFWNGLGYHFLIDNGTMGKGDGQIEMSPRWIRQQNGAHCKAAGMNEKAIGVALVGNFDVDTPTPNQMQALSFLLKTLSSYYHIQSGCIMGHGEVGGARTDCPGKRLPMNAIRQNARNFK